MECAAKVPGDLQKTDLRVLAWTDHFFGEAYLNPVIVPNPPGADISLTYTRDRAELPHVDAVWFHGPSIQDMPLRRDKRQPWILMSMESDVNYPALKHPATRIGFDLLMTYRLDSDIPCIYPTWGQYGDFLKPVRIHKGPAAGPLAAYIASNPVAYRDNYVAELMESIRVDSLGRCLRNRHIEGFVQGGWSQGAWDAILEVLSRYKFYLAFENSQTTDYVTERVFHALVAGVVPVYMGAPNVRDFMPAEKAVIVATDFDCASELANYLLHLDQNDSAYLEYLSWKNSGLSSQFRQLVNVGSINPQQRLAIKLAHACGQECTCGGRLREPSLMP